MTKRIVYRYLGTNGVIESPVFLEDIYYVPVVVLTADPGKKLQRDGRKVSVVRVPENEVDLWTEVDDLGQD